MHLPGVDFKDVQASRLVGVGEFDLAVNAAGTQQRSIQDVDTISCHEYLGNSAMESDIHEHQDDR